MIEAELLAEARGHDEALRRAGLAIWIGSEPTFTRAQSLAPAWLHEAEGDDKAARACELARDLSPRLSAHAWAVHAMGRHYDGEAAPRFSYGVAWRRDGAPLTPWTRAALALDAPAAPPPPPSAELAWLTVTPDPGVVEVNLAPSADLAAFAHQTLAVEAAAQAAGLSPTRFLYNGDETDSGS